MCDYSLEMYHSRPAEEGVTYETTRFPSHTIGFIEPGNAQTAVCMANGVKLALENVPVDIQRELAVKERETVTFAQLDGSMHRDGVRFENGAEITLQRLGTGVKAQVVDALVAPDIVPDVEKVETVRSREPELA